MKLELPLRYDVDFSKEEEEYTFYSSYCKNKKALRTPLLEVSKNYCMYGYDLIKTGDRSTDGKLEHSIEHSIYKENGRNPFHCKFNISIASEQLNNSYKRTKIKEIIFKRDYGCQDKYMCENVCEELKRDQKEYTNLNNIILMPYGSFYNAGELGKLEFDLHKLKFSSDNKMVEDHIVKIGLNNCPHLRKRILNYCKKILTKTDLLEYLVDTLEDNVQIHLVDKLFLNYLKTINKNNKIKIIAQLIIDLENNEKPN